MTYGDDLRAVLVRLIDLLEAERIAYLVMGGVVVTIWGIPRATYDLDLTLAVSDEEFDRFLRRAKAEGFAVDAPFERGFRDVLAGMQKIRIEWWTEASRRIEIDVFLVTTAYQTCAFARRVRARIDSRDAWVLTAADLLLHKLVAGRPKDLADVQNVLAVQGLVEPGYLREWALRLGVADRLDESLRRAGLAPPT